MSSPQISHFSSNGNTLEFRISGIDVSVANAIRRICLSDIERIAIGDFQFKKNTSLQFKNEIVAHRIQSIPVIPVFDGKTMTDDEMVDFCKTYRLELDVQNKGETMIYANSGDFRIIHRGTGEPLSRDAVRQLFPPYQQHYFFDIMRLYPGKDSQTIPGEHIQLEAAFVIRTAQEDSCFSVASKVSYQATPDVEKSAAAWLKKEKEERAELEKKGLEQQAIDDLLEYMKRDFNLLDAQRFYKSNSFDFVIESNGIYDNEDIVRRACIVMQGKIRRFVENLEAGEISIEESYLRPDRRNSTMENSYDIIIPGEDYTLGCVLSNATYKLFFEKSRQLTFCGFIKFHPHDKEVVLRLAFAESTERSAIQTCLIQSCRDASEVFQSIQGMMTRRGPKSEV